MFGSPANESNEKLEWRLMFSPGFWYMKAVAPSCGSWEKSPIFVFSETRNVRDSEIVVPN